MARQLEFDREAALQKAMRVFWRKGFAATSTEDLLGGMGVGRQSMYNTFGDKRRLYLASLEAYQATAVAGHLARLDSGSTALEGVRELLAGLAVEDDEQRSMGCLGVGSVGEFGAADEEVMRIAARANDIVGDRLAVRLAEAKASGELAASLDAAAAVQFVLTTMSGLQVSARGGASAESMRQTADFAVECLTAR